ncbi:MAG: response regulator [Trichodesmium sp.]
MRLLLIDNDEILIDLLRRTLTKKNYALDTVTDGEQGWIYGSTYPYDLIILDWCLPKLDGLSLCQRFRSHGYHMPILLMTVRNSTTEKIIALDAGVDDYLCKPFDIEELTARIRALLRRSKSNSAPLLTWGDLELNISTCQVTYQGHLILLTAKEYQLLELFMHHRQEVFGIEDILESLWSSLEYTSEATVRSHLRHLRKKLKQAGLPEDPIETIRGRGYCLKSLPPHKLEDNFVQFSSESQDERNTQNLVCLNTAWEKYQNKLEQQLTSLEEVIETWKADALTPSKLEEARLIAHTFAEILHIFGFNESSELANELEQLLQRNCKEEREQLLLEFQNILDDLRLQLLTEDNSSDKISCRLTEDSPLLLIIDNDLKFTELLTQKATAEGIRTVVATTSESARTWLEGLQYTQLPHVVIIRLSLASSIANSQELEERLSLIAEFNLLVPSIPVIVIGDRDRFEDRLFVTQYGSVLYLKQPILPSQAIYFCQQVLERSARGKKVMIVDDDVELLRVLLDLLEPWGFKLTTLDDPRQFWDVLQAVNPDLLVLDIEMPFFSGIELCKVLRSDPRWCKLPVLYLSIHTGADLPNEVFSSGADELIPKAILSKQIAERILHHLASFNIISVE